MKSSKTNIIVMAALLALSSCATSQLTNQNSSVDYFTIAGQWMITNDEDLSNRIYFDFRKKGSQFDLKVQGQKARLTNFRETHDQLIFTYLSSNDEPLNVLVTVLDENRIKFSQVTDPISEFHPVGKLGEKVYHMQKVNQGDLKLIANNLKR